MNKIILCIMLLSLNSFSKNEQENIPPYTDILKKCKAFLEKRKVKYIDICLSQFLLETGYFRSKIFLRYRNVSGMKRSYTRPQISAGYLLDKTVIYSNLNQSLEDFVLFYSHFANKKNQKHVQLWYDILETYYNTSDKDYIKKLKNIQKKLKNI